MKKRKWNLRLKKQKKAKASTQILSRRRRRKEKKKEWQMNRREYVDHLIIVFFLLINGWLKTKGIEPDMAQKQEKKEENSTLTKKGNETETTRDEKEKLTSRRVQTHRLDWEANLKKSMRVCVYVLCWRRRRRRRRNDKHVCCPVIDAFFFP